MGNSYPSDTFWSVKNLTSNQIFISNGYYIDSNKVYTEKSCVEKGRYLFSTSNTINETSTNDPEYKIIVGNLTIDEESIPSMTDISFSFIVCSSDADCNDYNGCTKDFCGEGGICDHKPLEPCSNCREFLLNIKLDAYPDETAWSLNVLKDNIPIISGKPYAPSLQSNKRYGRKNKSGR